MLNLETPRLMLRPWRKPDFPVFAEYFMNKDNTVFLGGSQTRESAWRLMAAYIGHLHLNGYSYMAVEEKSTGSLAGGAGLWNSEPWPELELGYWLLPHMQGKGYATEAARAVKNYALNTLKATSLVSYIAPENEASKRVAIKLGACFDREIQLLDFGLHHVYRYENSL